EQQRQNGGAARHDGTVGDLPADTRGCEELAIVDQRGGARQKRWRKYVRLAGRHQRRRHHPRKREQRQRRHQHQRDVDDDCLRLHIASRSRATRNCNSVTANMIANSTNATAEAEPRLHHLKPSSYMKYRTVIVRCAGPPCVITYGSAKIWKCAAIVRMLTSTSTAPTPARATSRT